jgi:hypothetical protein
LREEVLKVNVYKHDQAHFSVIDIPGLVSGRDEQITSVCNQKEMLIYLYRRFRSGSKDLREDCQELYLQKSRNCIVWDPSPLNNSQLLTCIER